MTEMLLGNTSMKILTIKLDDRSANRISRIAKARKTTKSQVVREAIERGLSSNESDPLADIRDLVGSIDGPADLSTNAKHLEGYGED